MCQAKSFRVEVDGMSKHVSNHSLVYGVPSTTIVHLNSCLNTLR